MPSARLVVVGGALVVVVGLAAGGWWWNAGRWATPPAIRRPCRQPGVRVVPWGRGPALAAVASCARHAAGDRGDRGWRFQRRSLNLSRRDHHLHPPRRKVRGADRWSRRYAAGLRGRVHVRRLAAAAISRPVPRRTPAGAVHRVGHAAASAGRAALVPSLPARERHPPRRAALDAGQPELEPHVRRVPLDGGPQELRRGALPRPTPRSA
jgi:hypothetical protein